MCDIWRKRNLKVKVLHFGRTTFLVSLNGGLILFLISNTLQESIIKTDVLVSFCTNHSPIFFSLQLKDMPTWGKSFWKFNNSLTSNTEYVEKMKNQISETLRMLDQNKVTDKHLRLEYEIRKFTMNFSKTLSKKRIKIETF